GAVDEGVAALRRAVAIARERDRPNELESAQTNLADALHIGGRSREALEVARTAHAEASQWGYKNGWLAVVVAELSLELGDWDEAARMLPAVGRRVGVDLVNTELRRVELMLGHGDHDAAAATLARIAEPVAASAEPQWHGPYGALLAELRRRQGDLDGARAAVDEALDRIEFCTEDVARLASVSAVGVTVEADRAQRGRDLGDADEAARAVADIEMLLARVEAAADADGPVEVASHATARADAARAAGEDDPALWVAAAEAWTAIERPYPAATARWREAEAHIAAGDREAAGHAASAALEITERLGAGWLHGEVEGLVARARLRLDGAPEPVDGDAAAA